MPSSTPFFPDDKPRSWVIAICAGLLGLLLGAVAFAAAWLEIPIVKNLATALFVGCWVIFAVCWLVFIVGQISGRYKGLRSRPWREQVW